jgi:coiled-coil domain-containing protein 12
MSSNHSSLSAAADERKARLAKLKSLKRKQPDDESAAPESPQNAASPRGSPDVAKAILSGRNYDPETKGPKLGFEAPPTLGVEKTLEQQAAEVEAEIKRKAKEDEEDDKGVDIFKLQPKKPNWDLKRDLDKKLEILNVRTENAIAALVRERIANAQKSAGGNVSNGTKEGITNGSKGAEEIGMDGAALVEGARLREHEDELEEQRDREDEDMA